MNENFELFRIDVQAFRKKTDVVKAESARCHKENEELWRDQREARREIVEPKYSQNMNIKIQALPQTKKDNLEKTVANIINCLGTDVADNTDVAHSVLSKDKKDSSPEWREIRRCLQQERLN